MPTPQEPARKPDTHGPLTTLTVRLDEARLKALDAWAREEGLTAGALARRILEDTLRRRKPQERARS